MFLKCEWLSLDLGQLGFGHLSCLNKSTYVILHLVVFESRSFQSEMVLNRSKEEAVAWMRLPFKVFEMCSKVSLGLIGRQHPLGAQFPTPQTSSEDSSGLSKFSPWELQVLSPGPKDYRPLARQGEQAELQTTVPPRGPSKSTIQGLLLPPQPARCSAEEVYGGLAPAIKFIPAH